MRVKWLQMKLETVVGLRSKTYLYAGWLLNHEQGKENLNLAKKQDNVLETKLVRI